MRHRIRRPRKPPRDSIQKAGKKAPVIDPYLPTNGNFGYRVSRYELELEYKVPINRLAGSATVTAVTLAALRTFTLDLLRCPHGDEGVGQRTATRFIQLFGRQAAHSVVVVAASWGGDVDCRPLRRNTPADPVLLGVKSVSRN